MSQEHPEPNMSTYDSTSIKVLKGLDNYTYYGEEENYQIPPLEDFIDRYIDYDIDPEDIEGCKNIFSTIYENFKQYIL